MYTRKELTVSKKFFSKYKTISDAIRDAKPGFKVFVEPGTYYENIIIDKDVEIIGKGSVDDIVLFSINISAIKMQTECASVRGITIRQGGKVEEKIGYSAVSSYMGSLTLENCVISSEIGIGIIVTEEGNPIIRECKIYSNKDSGVVFLGGSGIIENCEIYNNGSANVEISSEADPVLRGCKIYNSKQWGVVVMKKGRGTMENCEIYSNALDNVVIISEGYPVLKSCKIYSSEESGVSVVYEGRGTLENCEIYSNAKPNVVIDNKGDALLKSCKIYSGEQSGVLVKGKSRGIIEDCYIYDHRHDHQIHLQGTIGVLRNTRIIDGGNYGIYVESGYPLIYYCTIKNHLVEDIYTDEYSMSSILLENESLERETKSRDDKPTNQSKYEQIFGFNPYDLEQEELKLWLLEEQKKWLKRINAPSLERRQEAEQMLEIIGEAEKELLK
ncbi:right-handed parallel beta-helix repeat-containing protein [Alkalihalobacillus sp. LMS39]|uniref:right-handed parallel beta-helix repeat-containing protein n=1 Tax=Alkalihalobacillus sp. LMS39 TaxID=2924032 RepID=UPI001FB1B82D|nr:right-handed parallel beta-helix repeat-containing protein [Alkalihalobacillus sp. LMS39]UOE94783.1 right-handed parallel beta-helix repeat-containing protein [Alkalihalobacillus sp. LMS39]